MKLARSKWMLKGDKVLANSINVAKLVQSTLARTFEFKRIKKKYHEIVYKLQLILNTNKNIKYPPFVEDTSHRLAKLDLRVIEMANEANQLRTNLTLLQNLLLGRIEKLSNEIKTTETTK